MINSAGRHPMEKMLSRHAGLQRNFIFWQRDSRQNYMNAMMLGPTISSNLKDRQMKKLIITSVILMITISGYAQTEDYSTIKRNSIFGEVYLIRHDFSEGIASLNYERNIGKKQKAHLRVGIYPDFESTISFPLTISWITKPLSHHHFEYGIGAVVRIEHFVDPYGYTIKEWFYDVPAIMIPLMYRYQKNSGWFFRGGVNLFVSWPTLPSPSISVGYKF